MLYGTASDSWVEPLNENPATHIHAQAADCEAARGDCERCRLSVLAEIVIPFRYGGGCQLALNEGSDKVMRGPGRTRAGRTRSGVGKLSPLAFVREVLGEEPYDKQIEILRNVALSAPHFGGWMQRLGKGLDRRTGGAVVAPLALASQGDRDRPDLSTGG